MNTRIETLQKTLEAQHLDGYLITDEKNTFYFTDFIGADRLLIPANDESVLYVYSTNFEAAKAMAKNCIVKLLKRGEDVDKTMAAHARRLKLQTLGFDAFEVSSYPKVRKAFKDIKLKSMSQLVSNMRKVKDETEISYIRKAAQLTDLAARTLAEKAKPGMREFEVAAEAEYSMRKAGSEGTPFDTIVASGSRSAYPHGGCSSEKIKEGEFIQFDVSARVHNYCADLTRTFLIGKPTPKQQKMYDVVKEAQEEAFQKMKEGAKARLVDAAARRTIEKHGFGGTFVHGLGHGVGLAVHEQPMLNTVSKDILEAGNVVTDEPGIYLVGYGGARIEDTVLVKKEGAERLTKAPYDLVI